jgi:HEAT repeat protein
MNSLSFHRGQLASGLSGRFSRPRFSALACWCGLLLLASNSLVAAAPTSPVQATPDSRSEAVATLQADGPLYDRAMACRTLAVVGDAAAVDALAGVVGSPELGAYARLALEEIANPAATEALLTALKTASPVARVGIIGSLGRRGDPAAVATLTSLTVNDHAPTIDAAFNALAAIASDEAVGDLIHRAHAGTPRPAALTAAILLASERRGIQAGDQLAEQALKHVQTVVQHAAAGIRPQLAPHVDAADYQLVLRHTADASTRLARLLASDRDDAFRLGVQAAREVGDAGVAAMLTATATASAQRRIPLIDALSASGSAEALPAIIAAADADSPELRRIAIECLGNWPDEASIARLLKALSDSDEGVAAAASASLSRLDAAAVDQAVLARLTSEDPATLTVAIALAGSRGIPSAEERLFTLAASDNATVAAAAITSLGSVASQKRYGDLVELLTQTPGAHDVTRSALTAAARRLSRDACLDTIAEALTSADTAVSQLLLEVAGALEGEKALGLLAAAANSGKPPLVDTATRLLGRWSGPEAADLLAELAATLTDATYQTRAVRGLLRSIRQFDLSLKRRMALAVKAAAVAKRSEEQALVLEVLGRYPSPSGLSAALHMLGNATPETLEAGLLPIAEAVAAGGEEDAVAALTELKKAVTGTPLQARVAKLQGDAARTAKTRAAEAGFVALFDGSSLAGWVGDRSVWKATGGAIVGGSLDEVVGTGNDFLCTEATYDNFELRLQFRLQGETANGGVNVRSLRRDDGVAAGYQADLGNGCWGGLYDEARRNRFVATAQLAPTLSTDWNDYRIRCEGDRIRIWLNGTLTVDYVETEELPCPGIIALQVQAGRKVQAAYRQIRIRELAQDELQPVAPEATPAEAAFTPLFDGETFTGWHGNLDWFRIENETIIAGSLEKPIPRNEFLRTDKAYADFELRLQFQLRGGNAANAGVQIRTAEIPDHHEVSGYQADMGNGWWGCLYDESRRNRVLAGPAPQDRGTMLRPDDWNDYRIRCEGDRVRLWINDVLTVDYTEADPEIARTGIIAVQVHSGPPTEAWYRKIRLLSLD